LWTSAKDAFKQVRISERARSLAYGALTCLGKRTVTGILTATGRQFTDWSSSYRVFGKDRINTTKLFDVAIRNTVQELSSSQMIIAHMDDTIIKKTGRKVAGTAWRRDPLGPPFHTNFIWGQRFVQMSMALPQQESECQSRAIPIDFHHCPTIRKPDSSALPNEVQAFKEQQRIAKLSKQGSLRIGNLRQKLDEHGQQDRELFICVDGSYTNTTVLKSLPQRVTLIGRTRKDTKLYLLPEKNTPGAGRKRVYGDRLPTPEQIRKDDQYPWQKAVAWAAGKTHDFSIKIIKDLRWRAAGELHTMQLVIIRPLSYRLTKSSKILYRSPAYLLCTDCNLSIEKLLQAYLWRWEIEVNFRDQKTLMGCGQAQVRTANAVKNVPAFMTAMYSFMHLAAHRAYKKRDDTILPRPLWHPAKDEQRMTSSEIVNLFRAQIWNKEIKNNFSGFVKNQHQHKSLRNIVNPMSSAIFYARK